jgi:cellulose synthase/poly-beta-1,6-N-acetylglucosamine synthase-like glycosyltransferase
MIYDALYWFSGFSTEQYLMTFSGMLLLDGPRYLFANLVLLMWTFFSDLWHGKQTPKGAYLPTVCALIPGLNESATMRQCLETIHGSYPFLQIIVIDDGSTDGTFEIASKFAETHSDVLVLRRPHGGGKSTAQNFAYPYITAEIIVVIDSDSTFGPDAIYRLVQPFRDPEVGGTSGCILVRNPTDSLCTLFQAYEYLISIMVGRVLSAKMGMLSIISGAFGAFRTDIFRRGYGMDVGPSEDSDITIRIRKMGYKVVFVPESECYTDVPIKWKQLWNQRLRWDMGIVRIHLRKHIEGASLVSNNFRFTNFLYWYDTMFFSVWCTFSFWFMLGALFLNLDWQTIKNLSVCVALGYGIFGFFQVLTVMFYSVNLKRDLLPCIVFPLYSLYGGFFMRAVRTVACIDELINRSSYRDNYVPNYVQRHAYLWKTKY